MKIHNSDIENRRRNSLLLAIKVLVFSFLFYLLSRYKPLLLLIVFEILDFFKNVVKQSIRYIPLDLEFVFGVTAAYFYSPLYSIIIFFLGIMNRIIMMSLELRHLTKSFRHIAIFLAIPLFKSIPFLTLSILALLANYALKYLFMFFGGRIGDFDKVMFHVINFILASTLFGIISMLYQYLPLA